MLLKAHGVILFARIETRALTKLAKNSKEQQPAETRFEKISEFYNSSLLKAQIITGRRHQIRRYIQIFSSITWYCIVIVSNRTGNYS